MRNMHRSASTGTALVACVYAFAARGQAHERDEFDRRPLAEAIQALYVAGRWRGDDLLIVVGLERPNIERLEITSFACTLGYQVETWWYYGEWWWCYGGDGERSAYSDNQI